MITEDQFLENLGIAAPDLRQSIIAGKTRLLILDATSHLDWDWLLPFPMLADGRNSSNGRGAWYFKQDFNGGYANKIFNQAAGFLTDKTYHYSICEIGFLKAFALTDNKNFTSLIGTGGTNNNLRFAGGGITSADSVLPHGETFIRNYLLGNKWLSENCAGVPSPCTAWMPDNFSHDPQLPAVLQAMGFVAMGFERLPGTDKDNHPNTLSGAPGLASVLSAAQVDFTWTAADGSAIIGHWLIQGYSQANSSSAWQDFSAYLNENGPTSPTPYIYVPASNDFSLPNPTLATSVKDWNAGQNLWQGTPVEAVCASFEDYAQLLQYHQDSLSVPYGNQFNANPCSTGCYASKPAIKILHSRASRTLLAAEVFSIIAGWAQPGGDILYTGASWTDQLEQAWELLLPSTHHDYITGTAIPDVYYTEQLPLLEQADKKATALLQAIIQTITGSIGTGNNGIPIAVFNPLGTASSGIVQLLATDLLTGHITIDGPGIQKNSDGTVLFMADKAPPLGYKTFYFNGPVSAVVNPASIVPASKLVLTGNVVLSNGLVSATLAQGTDGRWGLISVIDLVNSIELLQTQQIGNELLFYADGGDEYQFGMESPPGNTWKQTDVSASLSAPVIEIIESGPLRVTVRTSFTYTDNNGIINYIQDYLLHANEPLLRMRTTGAAPVLPAQSGTNQVNGCAVVLSFPLANNGTGIEKLERGTPNHWTDISPEIYWNDQTFLATHDFVLPYSNNSPLCAFYHKDIPAWGLSNQWNGTQFETNNGTLYACILRNGDAHFFNWICAQYSLCNAATPIPAGADTAVHTHEYALRIGSGLQPAASGQPLRESKIWATPLQGLKVSSKVGSTPDSASLGEYDTGGGMINAVKYGSYNSKDIIFRLYQPTNTSLNATLNIGAPLNSVGNVAVRGVTALERELNVDNEAALEIVPSTNAVTFLAKWSLTTLAITPSTQLSI